MRVIAGSARGRRLRCLKGLSIRPTADRVKEALYSSLSSRLPGARVLDLFAGSGALGIEAWSRGAGSVTFVEQDSRAARLIGENLAACGWQPTAELRVVRQEALRWLAAQNQSGTAAGFYDLILADPPYGQGHEAAVLGVLGRGGLLAPGGVAVLESRAGESLPEEAGGLRLYKQKIYGECKISYYAAAGSESA